ncbi:RNA dependent RNA polymerase [Oceanobacillus sp. FSL H7-0719]|uniref:RNA dependent RNA polymerase n=1 Tax=Oceanobacillus sp. FSL H7-0719 TaxID=2954507 RepID=UPI00324E769A
MQSRQFFTLKFHSSRLKEFDYDISLTFDEAKENNEVIALFDSQILRSIRDINKRTIDYKRLEELHNQRDRIKKYEHSESNAKRIQELQDEINNILYIPEYITIVIESNAHYRHLYKNKLKINGKTYSRFNSSASQARVSTVTFVEDETAEILHERLDNGRNKNKPIAPSKFNAYKGLAGSSTQVVSTPRFCVVPDYESPTTFDAHKVTENDNWDEDDTMKVESVTEMFDRFDGQGLISIEKAKEWADELGLDYIPAQWCIRQNYTKGMLCTFDIKRFCETENRGQYIINTSYKDECGNPVTADLRDIDVILSESQAKLWDSWDSQESYEKNCEKNKLEWGVTLFTPKKDKDILTMNYQFMQTLNLDKSDIEKVSEKFVDWIAGISHNNIHYTILFLLGENVDSNSTDKLMNKSDKHWLKSLILFPDLISDKYIKRKIHNMVKKKIERACLGDIIVDGNFQVIVSDPYAQMQHICGQDEVTGLLGKGEYYSNYWNKKGVKTVDSMRSPLTYRSEHVVLDLVNNERLNKWYEYCYTGIILNIHGSETVNYAGSDFDYDILATTSDETVIKGVYRDELPVVYDPPKTDPKIIDKNSEDLLYNADLFSFGSIIGSITNKSTSGYALLTDLEKGTEEYSATLNRIRMCTKLQSAQIDKAKIGRKVKGIPKPWTQYQKINEDDPKEIRERKELENSIMLDKHPYFFTYLYPDTKKKYRSHYSKYDTSSQQRFGITLGELISKNRKTKEQKDFLEKFNKYSPTINSDSVMNSLCRYIESVDFEIKEIVKKEEEIDYRMLMSGSFEEIDEQKYKEIINTYNKYRSVLGKYISINKDASKSKFDDETYLVIKGGYDKFKEEMNKVCSNTEELVNHLIYMFYADEFKYNKDILWNLYGNQIFKNIKQHVDHYYVPHPNEDGSLEYLNNKYEIRKVEI